ncbi:serine/threonine-protein phosphatase 6 regulatory ankyrin repeat subunit B-like [Schistocerca gregaria]|uniref:serine/threonine-protein phosphatase 6 regulatory ankyrin repeat subunit B-like n=1 Tax=Schistocerca gregaria TaxID=7010 RepID=UPI00211DF7E0|nr:serine/threonine-protein phosphatase 6 regulatory ankyrin repeat subunit B-like [Schistocerca gregaria]
MGVMEDDWHLRQAAYNGDIKTLREMISNGADPRIKDDEGKSILMDGACHGHLEMVKFLVEEVCIPLEECDRNGNTTLLCASLSMCPNLEVLQYLVSSGADLQARNLMGETALHIASRSQSLETFKFLQQSGIPIDSQDLQGKTVLHHAAELGDAQMVKYLLDQKCLPVDCRDKYGQTPLMLTAEFPRSEQDPVRHGEWIDHTDYVNKALKLIVGAGADPTAKDVVGRTALHRALGCKENFQYLQKIHPNFKDGLDKNGQSAIMRAISAFQYNYDVPQVIKLLVQGGADVNLCDGDGKTALCLAIEKDAFWALKELVEGGVTLSSCRKDELSDILHMALWRHQDELVTRLIAAGADVNSKERGEAEKSTLQGHTARCLELNVLSHRGEGLIDTEFAGHSPLFKSLKSEKIVTHLIAAGADVNFKDDNGCTPLLAAIHREHFEALDLLLKAGADRNVMDNCGVTALHLAASCRKVPPRVIAFAKEQIEHGMRPDIMDHQGRTPLHYAALTGNHRVMKLLISLGANVNAVDVYGKTPIVMLAIHSRKDCRLVKELLINAGADLTVRDKNGKTALHTSFEIDNFEITKFLMEKHQQEIGCDNNGNNILHCAVRARRDTLDKVKYILNKKLTTIEEKNENGETALMYAVQLPSFHTIKQTLVQILLTSGASLNAKDKQGKTPLHIAAAEGDAKTMETLIAAGADVTERDLNGRMPLHWAAQSHRAEAVELLLNERKEQHEMGINQQDNGGQTPLMLAVKEKQSVKLLLKQGANVNTQDCAGRTALQAAIECKNFDAMKLLLVAGADFLPAQREYHVRAIHLAVAAGDNKILEHLISMGMDLLDCWWDPEHKTTLLHVAAETSVEMLKQVLNMGKSVDTFDNEGYSAFHRAVLSGNCAVIKYFLEELQTPVDQTDAKGRTSLILVAASDNWLLMKSSVPHILLHAGADASAQDNENMTAYDLALRSRNQKYADLLEMAQHLC